MSANEEMRTFLDMARERWSVRKFKQEQIEKIVREMSGHKNQQ